jgi:hypothetical protein
MAVLSTGTVTFLVTDIEGSTAPQPHQAARSSPVQEVPDV